MQKRNSKDSKKVDKKIFKEDTKRIYKEEEKKEVKNSLSLIQNFLAFSCETSSFDGVECMFQVHELEQSLWN